MKELQEIIGKLKALCETEGLEASPDMILDCAVRIMNTGRMNKEEKVPSEKPFPYPRKSSNPNEPITEKQRAFLEKSNYQGDINTLSKGEAHALISGIMKGGHER